MGGDNRRGVGIRVGRVCACRGDWYDYLYGYAHFYGRGEADPYSYPNLYAVASLLAYADSDGNSCCNAHTHSNIYVNSLAVANTNTNTITITIETYCYPSADANCNEYSHGPTTSHRGPCGCNRDSSTEMISLRIFWCVG